MTLGRGVGTVVSGAVVVDGAEVRGTVVEVVAASSTRVHELVTIEAITIAAARRRMSVTPPGPDFNATPDVPAG